MLAGAILKYLGPLIILASFGVYLSLVSTTLGDPGKSSTQALLVELALLYYFFE